MLRHKMRPGLRLDTRANRAAEKYSEMEWIRRTIWAAGRWLVRLSPRPCFSWRAWVLRRFGARIGSQVHIYPTTRIYFPWNLEIGAWSAIGEDVFIYNLGFVTIGERVTISHGAHLCAGTHDFTRVDMPLLRPPIHIEDQAWICAEAFIGPGVVVGEGAVVGARAVVVGDVSPWMVSAGNPARPLKRRELR